LVSVTSGIIPAVPAQPDDPEIIERLARLGWRPGEPLPTITRLAAYGVIRRDGRLLLARVAPGNLGAGRWVLPGGGLEFGEAPEPAAVREVEEETGLHARITGPPAIHSDIGEWPFSGGPLRHHQVRFVYPMEIVGGAERPEVGGSSDVIGWFTEAEIARLEAEDRAGDLVARVVREVAAVNAPS
jgi:ADP-ribose pyrophosphatase YjhB (NUDIX family)